MPLATLPNHAADNEKALALIKSEQTVMKYTRHNWIDKFGDLKSAGEVGLRGVTIEGAQKVRLSVVDSISDDADIAPESANEETVDSGGDSSSD